MRRKVSQRNYNRAKKKQGRSARTIIAAALVLGLCAAAFALFSAGRMSPAAEVFASVSAPLQQAGSFLRQNAAHLYGQALEYEALLQENEALRQELAAWNTEKREERAALRENQRLRELLGLRTRRTDLTLESARVLSTLQSNWGRSIILDKGSAAGLSLGDCVIDSRGALVGTISSLGTRRASVQLICDAAFVLGGEAAESAATGILEGELSLMAQNRLQLCQLDKDCGTQPGEEVVTFASQGIYPHGLLVGTVEEVTLDPSGLSRSARIKPAAALEDLYQLFVITDFTQES